MIRTSSGLMGHWPVERRLYFTDFFTIQVFLLGQVIACQQGIEVSQVHGTGCTRCRILLFLSASLSDREMQHTGLRYPFSRGQRTTAPIPVRMHHLQCWLLESRSPQYRMVFLQSGWFKGSLIPAYLKPTALLRSLLNVICC